MALQRLLMGLSAPLWRLMRERLPRGDLLSFGYPDALFDDPAIPESAHANEVRATHGYTGRAPNTEALFRANGWEMMAIDAFPSRGVEMAHDLNKPVPQDLHGQFDAVLDAGTGEHVFNIGQVFVSALAALKLGGTVLHEHPLIYGNHGFWCTQPTAMLDFYRQNGCEAETWIRSGNEIKRIETERFAVRPDKSLVICLARKVDLVPLCWPTQSRFL